VKRFSLATLAAAMLSLTLQHGLSAQRPAPTFSGFDFLTVRYGAGGSVSVYAGYRIGWGMAVAGVTGNRAKGTRSVIAGPGTHLRLGSSGGVMTVLAAAQSGEVRSLRLYLLPGFRVGALRLGATAMALQPLGAGSRELSINPATALLRVGPRVYGGVALSASAAQDKEAKVALGPSVRARFARGLLSVDVFAPATAAASRELRVAYSAEF